MTVVKNNAQAQAYGVPRGTAVAIAVPQIANPQGDVNLWRGLANLDLISRNVAFGEFWHAHGDHDYKNLKGCGPKYDAYANFEYGATGDAAGFSIGYLQFAVSIGKGEWPGTNNPINVNDINSGYYAIANGGALGTTNWTPPAASPSH